jgi:beta-lactamase regulating signal transducer with metallopeptidase domain
MNSLSFLGSPFMIALGWALVHFLWQGTVVALILAAANSGLRKSSACVRYGLACAAMALMVTAMAGTFVWFGFTSSTARSSSAMDDAILPGMGIAAQAGTTSSAIGLRTQLVLWLPWLDCLWLAGVLVISTRSAGGWIVAQRLKRTSTTPADPVWEQRAKRLAQALKVSRPVRMAASALARLPMVVGWLRPVILVPASAFTGMDAQQLEALLAHELAHIRRHDYLVNLIQTAAETLLFYHPAVWWVGRRIRIERENCCDDLAVATCGDVLTYARALTRLEELRAPGPQYALAAGGGLLITRIRRLMAGALPAEHTAKTWIVAALAILTAGGVWAGTRVAPAKLGESAGIVSESRAEQPAQAESKSFIDDLAGAGYANLTVDQLIAFKIHGVTPEYIRRLRAAGMANLAPDQLVAFRIHGVTADYAAQMKALKFGEISVDQLVAMRIHGVTPEYGNDIRLLGIDGMTADHLIAFRIHRVEAGQVREMQSLGLGTPTADQVVALRIHDVTPEFVRSLKAAGVKNLTFDKAIAARIHGGTASSVVEAIRNEIKRVITDMVAQLKQAWLDPFGII